MTIKKEKINTTIALILTFTLILGIVSGIIISKNHAVELKSEDFSGSGQGVFLSSFMSNTVWLLIMALASLNIFLTPLIFVSVFAKGLFYGYGSGCIVAKGGFSSFLCVMWGAGIHNFLFFCILVFYGAVAFTKSAECFLNRRNYDFKKRALVEFLVMSVLALFLTLSASFAESLTYSCILKAL